MRNGRMRYRHSCRWSHGVGAVVTALLLSASPAFGITVRDVIELSRAGVGDDVLIELIHGDDVVEPPDVAAVREMKAARVSDDVILAMLRASRRRLAEPFEDDQMEVAGHPEVAWDAGVPSRDPDGQRPHVNVNGESDVRARARATGVGRSQLVGNLYPVPLVICGGGHPRGVGAGCGSDPPRTKEPERPAWIVKTDGWIVKTDGWIVR